MADRLAREEGLHVGHSSGANVVRGREDRRAGSRRRAGGGCVVAIVCDRGDRYFAPDEVGAALRLVSCPAEMSDRPRQPWALGDARHAASASSSASTRRRGPRTRRDEESCGLLVGPARTRPLVLDDIVPMENRANKLHALDPETYPRTGRMYFDIDPLAFERMVSTRGDAKGSRSRCSITRTSTQGRTSRRPTRRRPRWAGRACLRPGLPRHERVLGESGGARALRLGRRGSLVRTEPATRRRRGPVAA